MIFTEANVDSRFEDTVYLIESDAFFVWEKYHHFGEWVQDSMGRTYTVGTRDGAPIVICFSWFTINGCRVAFYETTSMLVDHQMVGDWLHHHLPKLRSTDRMNVAHAFQAVEKASGIKMFKGNGDLFTARMLPYEAPFEEVDVDGVRVRFMESLRLYRNTQMRLDAALTRVNSTPADADEVREDFDQGFIEQTAVDLVRALGCEHMLKGAE